MPICTPRTTLDLVLRFTHIASMLTLQKYLADNGITATQLAQRCGIDLSTASQIIKGRRVPSISTLRAIREMAPGADLYLSIAFYVDQSTHRPRK